MVGTPLELAIWLLLPRSRLKYQRGGRGGDAGEHGDLVDLARGVGDQVGHHI